MKDKSMHDRFAKSSTDPILAVYLLEQFAKQPKKREHTPFMDIMPPKSNDYPVFFGAEEKKQLKGSQFSKILGK